MSLIFAAYGLLAGLALWATCRDEYMRWLGLWLMGEWLLSNILVFGGVPAQDRIGPYSMLQIMIAIAAAWGLRDRSRWLIGVLLVCVVYFSANIALALEKHPDPRQIYLWIVTTNLAFAVQCLLAFGIGVAQRARTGHFGSWLVPDRQTSSMGAQGEASWKA